MALNFPSSPSANDTYSFSGVTWEFDGQAWVILTSNTTSTSTAGAGYFNSSISAFPGASANKDYAGDENYVGESPAFDSFGVSVVETFSCMDPTGSLTTVDLGALT